MIARGRLVVFVLSLRYPGAELNQFCLPPIFKSTDPPLLCRNILSRLHLLNQPDVQLSCMSLCVAKALLFECFYQQIGLKFEEETSEVLHLEHGFVWC